MTAVRKPQLTFSADSARFTIRNERRADIRGREALLDISFGDSRHGRTCQRLRHGRVAALAFSAVHGGRLIATVRLWDIDAGGKPALLLGPLAVDPAWRDLGIGGAMMNHALAAARRRGHGAIILLGDAPYYSRFGFSVAKTQALALPGPFEPERLLGLELRHGALKGTCGMVRPTGMALGQTDGTIRRAA